MLPRTRYQGSKLKLVDKIVAFAKELLPHFDSILDVFGGTGILSLYLQQQGKHIIYNDIMKYNGHVARALLNSDDVSDTEIDDIFKRHDGIEYTSFIANTFTGIYFTDIENEQLDMALQNIQMSTNSHKRDVLMYLLCQACLIKRPYNLFHRKNLEMRLKNVNRSFGNKVSWDTPFATHMHKFNKELQSVKKVSNTVIRNSKVLSLSYVEFESHHDEWNKVDTVYLDPPYFKRDKPNRDYLDYYHFLEGMSMYNDWSVMVDTKAINRCFLSEQATKYTIQSSRDMFMTCIRVFSSKNIIISYRKDGFPSIEWIVKELYKYKTNVVVHEVDYKYALSKKDVKEVVMIAW